MVLIIEDRTYSEKCQLKDLERHPNLIRRSVQFARSTDIKQPENEINRTIYVIEREFTVVSRDDPHGFHFVGSDEATTCHILVIDNHVAVALMHLDGCETRESIESMLTELAKTSNEKNYDVYLVGGFIEQSSKNYSVTLSNEILDTLTRRVNDTFHLQLAAITNYNDHVINRIHYPMIYGICFDIRDKTIRKMTFRNFGPALLLRMVYHSSDSHSSYCLYSSLNGEISIPKFRLDEKTIERYYRPLYKYYFHDDKELLRLTSTSPEQERPIFLENMKKRLIFILKYAEKIPDWFDSKTNSIVFRWIDQQWKTDNSHLVENVDI